MIDNLLSALRLGSCQSVRRSPYSVSGLVAQSISTLMPMGQPSGSLFNSTPSFQLSICDQTRFRPAVASSLTFSLWGGVRNSLPKRPIQHSFAICNKARFWLACSNIKKNNNTCEATIRGVSDLPVPLSWTCMFNDSSAGFSLFAYKSFKFRTMVFYDSVQYVF